MNTMPKYLLNSTVKTEPSNDVKSESPKKEEPLGESPKKEEPLERILTVDIKTMRTHMKNENFNNYNTLLEFFPKIHQIARVSARMTRLTLRCQDNLHTMQAAFYGDIRPFATGDFVRCVGHLIGQSGQFKVVNMTKIDYERELNLINRLIAICCFELAKMPIKTPNQPQK